MERIAYERFALLEDTHFWFVGRRAIFFDLLDRELAGRDGLQVLEIGCGAGGMLGPLRRYGRVHGMDVDREYLGFCRRRGFTDLLCGSGHDLPFRDQSFDVIALFDTLEHIPDEHRALTEVRRVLKPGGLAYLYVHSFTSISGGHHIAWKYPDREPSTTVPPWDHLREKRFPDIPSWLNGMREHQYREIFERHFLLEDWLYTHREGEKLLTPEIRAELGEYSEHELLTKGFIAVGAPRP